MADVHAPLAYYWDHESELDEDIERRSRLADEYRSQSATSPLAQRLAAARRVGHEPAMPGRRGGAAPRRVADPGAGTGDAGRDRRDRRPASPELPAARLRRHGTEVITRVARVVGLRPRNTSSLRRLSEARMALPAGMPECQHLDLLFLGLDPIVQVVAHTPHERAPKSTHA